METEQRVYGMANGNAVLEGGLSDEENEKLDKADRESFMLRNGPISLEEFKAKLRPISVKVWVTNEQGNEAPGLIELLYDPSEVTDEMRAQFLEEQRLDPEAHPGEIAMAFPRAICKVVKGWNVVGPFYKTMERRWEEVLPEGCDPDTDWTCEVIERSERKRVMIVEPDTFMPLEPHYVKHLRSEFTQAIMSAIFTDVQGANPERQRSSRKRR